jgi:hypothetical protein
VCFSWCLGGRAFLAHLVTTTTSSPTLSNTATATTHPCNRCRKRYAIFKAHYAATLRLKNYFPFTLIDAMGMIEETRQQITKELRWVVGWLVGWLGGLVRVSKAL